MEDADAALVHERAGIVDRATDILEQMLDDVVARVTDRRQGPGPRAAVGGATTAPTSPTAARSRPTCASRARTSPFYETQVSGIPVSEKLEVFAADNRMATCAPPRDLTR